MAEGLSRRLRSSRAPEPSLVAALSQSWVPGGHREVSPWTAPFPWQGLSLAAGFTLAGPTDPHSGGNTGLSPRGISSSRQGLVGKGNPPRSWSQHSFSCGFNQAGLHQDQATLISTCGISMQEHLRKRGETCTQRAALKTISNYSADTRGRSWGLWGYFGSACF